MGSVEDWLAEHAGELIECRLGGARIRKSLCRDRQQWSPGCLGCSQAKGAVPKDQKCSKCKTRPAIDFGDLCPECFKGLHVRRTARFKKQRRMAGIEVLEGGKMAKALCNHPNCSHRGEEVNLVGRGLCSACYYREKRAGTLEANYPIQPFLATPVETEQKAPAAEETPAPAPAEASPSEKTLDLERCLQGHEYLRHSGEGLERILDCPWCEILRLQDLVEAAQKPCDHSDLERELAELKEQAARLELVAHQAEISGRLASVPPPAAVVPEVAFEAPLGPGQCWGLQIRFSSDRDHKVRALLGLAAENERRTPEAQALVLLECAFHEWGERMGLPQDPAI